MAKSLLHVFDKQASPQKPRASGGGAQTPRDVMNYATPQIPGYDPKGHSGPGLGGDNHRCGTQGTHERMKGSPGIGGTRYSDGLDNDDTVGRPDRD